MNLETLVMAVRSWGQAKGINNSDPLMQFVKFQEEAGEIASNLFRFKATEEEQYLEALKDDIGDTMVTLILLSETLNLDIRQCLEIAYCEIAGRKGTTKNGGFVKEEPSGNPKD